MPRIKIEPLPRNVELTEAEMLELYGAGKPRFRPAFEILEERIARTGGLRAEVVRPELGGPRILRVFGTAGDDKIVLRQSREYNQQTGITSDPMIRIDGVFESDGRTLQKFSPTSIQKIEIYATQGGNDFIHIASDEPVPTTGSMGIGIQTPALIVTGHGRDTIVGGYGNDTIYAQGEDDVIWSNPGNDEIHAGDGHDTIMGGPGNDTIHGLGGNDSIDGQDGDDIIYGGEGDDRLHDTGVTETATGGLNTMARDQIFGDAGEDDIAGGVGNDWLWGGEDRDVISGQTGDDEIFGGAGNDALYGHDGNDVIHGQDGNDYISGDRGDDALTGGEGDDRIYAGDGTDVVHGGAGNDILKGGAGSNIVVGGTGQDYLLEGGDGILVGGDLTVGENATDLRMLLDNWNMQLRWGRQQAIDYLVTGWTVPGKFGGFVSLAGQDDGVKDYISHIPGRSLTWCVWDGPTADWRENLPNPTAAADVPSGAGGARPYAPPATIEQLVGTWRVIDFSEDRMNQRAFWYDITIDSFQPPVDRFSTPQWTFSYTVNGNPGTGWFFPSTGLVQMVYQFRSGDQYTWDIGAQFFMNAEGQWVLSGSTRIAGAGAFDDPHLIGRWFATKLTNAGTAGQAVQPVVQVPGRTVGDPSAVPLPGSLVELPPRADTPPPPAPPAPAPQQQQQKAAVVPARGRGKRRGPKRGRGGVGRK